MVIENERGVGQRERANIRGKKHKRETERTLLFCQMSRKSLYSKS